MNLGTMQIIWVGVFVLCLIIEIITLGLTSIWFAVGAIVAFILSLFKLPIPLQAVLFVVVSWVLLMITRPIAVKYMKVGSVKTNYENIIGKIGIVEVEINNLEAFGKVKLNGQIWSAKSEDDDKIEVGTEVKVTAIQGVKLIVVKYKEEN